MKNNTGVFNSRNYINDYMHGLRYAAVKSPVRYTIESYAEKIASRYEAWLTVAKGAAAFDPRMVTKAEHFAQEYEAQMALLVEYADELAEVGISSCPRMLKELSKLQVEYPADLLAARRASFIAQIETGVS